MDKKRILLVDYEPRSIDRILSFIGDRYAVDVEKDGIAALDSFNAKRPDLVLLRAMIPKKHGFQVCQEMVGIMKDVKTPIIMHTAVYKGRKYREDALRLYGATEYIEHPIEKDALLNLLSAYLDEGKPVVSHLGEKEEIETIEMPQKAKKELETKVEMPQTLKQIVEDSGIHKTKKKLDPEINKKLEDTLSGLTMKKKPAAKAATAEPFPLPEIEILKPKPSVSQPEPPQKITPQPPVPPVSPVEAKVPPNKMASKIEPSVIGEPKVTSEEIFGKIIADVESKDEKQVQAEKLEKKETQSQKMPPPPPETLVKSKEEKIEELTPKSPFETQKMAKPDIPLKEFSLPSVSIKKEDTGVKRLQEKSLKEFERKLEETLGGVKVAKKPQGVTEKKPQPEKQKISVTPPKPPLAPPVPPPKEEEPGIKFGQYLLVEKIATGGMAELYKAKQRGMEGFQKIVAIKKILPHLSSNQEFVTMFIDEAKLAAQLTHPNIVHIYDLGKISESFFIAMEYVEGKDLRAILKELEEKKVPFPPKLAVYVAHKICAALHYAHNTKDIDGRAMELVHRDISPQNILISTHGEVKLADFGIAKAVSKASHTQSGSLKGKLLYMSPEQAWGKAIDKRSDIFSLGTVLAEMLFLKKLFMGDSEMSILEKVREAKFPPLKELNHNLPNRLEEIMIKTLKRSETERYQDCIEFSQELEKFCYEEYGAVPTSFELVSFLSDVFPSIYQKEALQVTEKTPEKVAAPPAKKEKKAGKEKKEAKEKREVEKAPVQEQKKKVPIPPSDSAVKRMTDGMTVSSSKPFPVIPVAIAAVVLILILAGFFVIKAMKGKHVSPPTTSPQEKLVAKPPVIKPPEIEQPKIEANASEQEIQKAKATLARSIETLKRSINSAESTDAVKYAPEPFKVAKESLAEAQRSLKSAKTPSDISSIFPIIQRGIDSATEAHNKSASAKAAEEQQKAQSAQQEEEGKKKAAEEIETKRKAEEEKRLQEESKKKEETHSTEGSVVKKGDFVEAWALDAKPEPIGGLKAEYTPIARSARVSGDVFVEVTIDENGNPTSAKIIKGPDYGLHEACIKAAMKTKYTPPLKNSIPVKTTTTYHIKFNM